MLLLSYTHIEGTWVWIGGYALEHDRRSTVAERTIDHVRVTSDPTNVSNTGKDVFVWVVVKCILGEEEKGGKEGGLGRGSWR